ncbi:integrase, catalytic region, zinc finger, CCHC-type containing protein [Tanacetum coccineum]|uniref:Integrase, catalytic region, zinc finger, CCHC-type containing protein n=1 Tax=Tanacetum coccineum TaxID=301880 RepID=A0ABQ5I193_9ASTR
MRMILKDRNVKEESLQKELHYVKMQLNFTLNHNKLIREEVSTFKQDFKQKENKLLEEFLDMKHLKEKVEDKLYKQDQFLQTVHMLCKPKSFYDEVNRVAIGYKNPFYLSKAKQVQPALYNGYEIVKTNHARALVHDSEDTLEIDETTRKYMIEKMKDLECVKKKAKPLKEKAKSAKPITTMTVYPPHTPAKLVPKFLPTKGQVQVNIYSLVQLFSEFDKTCKKRITPTVTKGEKGFEQTKTCYLTEVIPFFNTIKEHFKEIQKALVNKIKEMKEIFDQMEAEVDQHVVDKKYDEIRRKNLLIENENLIVACLSKKIFYTETDYVLTVSRFSGMHDAYTAAQRRIAKLEAANFNLTQKIQKDDHNEMIIFFPNLSEADPILDFKALDSQNKDLNAKVNALQDLNEHFRIKGKMKCVTMSDPVKTKVLAPGVKDATAASGSKPRSNTKKDRTLPAKSDTKKVEDHSRNNKSSVKQKNHIVLWYLDSGCSKYMTGYRSRLRNFVKKFIGTVRFENDHFGAIIGYGDYVIVDSVISRVYYVEGLGHNLFSVRQFCDSDLEVALRKHSCYVREVNGVDLIKGNRHTNLYTISIEDMMKSSPICLLSKASKTKSWLWHRRLNHLNFGIFHQKSVPRTPQHNGIVERQNRTLVEATRTMLIFSKAPMFLWAEVKPDLKFLRAFGALCYLTNDSKDLGKLRPTADIGIFLTEPMAPVHISTGPEPILLTPRQISSGLVPDPLSAAPHVPPTNKDLEILFQPMFDEYFEPPVGPTIEDNHLAQAYNDPFVNVFAPEPSSDESSSGDVSSAEYTQVVHPHNHLGKWSKDHPLDNVIVKPKNVKTAMDEACWFEAMQEEIHEFDRI